MKAVAKKVMIGVAGGTVLVAGVVMIVLPGPALLVIPAGLAILATEFEWAHRWRESFKTKFHQAREAYRRRKERAARP